MAYLRIIQSETIDREIYEQLSEAIDIDHRHPLGLIMHAAGEVDGRWQIVNVWESADYAARFDRESLEPTFRDVIGKQLEDRQVTGYEVGHLITP